MVKIYWYLKDGTLIENMPFFSFIETPTVGEIVEVDLNGLQRYEILEIVHGACKECDSSTHWAPYLKIFVKEL